MALQFVIPVFCQNPDTVTVPYCENFDGYGVGDHSFPGNWVSWRNFDGYAHPCIYGTNHSTMGLGSLELFSGNFVNSYTLAITPYIDIADIRDLKIQFYGYSASTDAFLEVGLIDNVNLPGSFVPVDTFHVTYANVWQLYSLSLENYAGTEHCIGFRLSINAQPSDGRGRYYMIDDLSISTCFTASDISITNLSDEEALVSWNNAGATGYLIEYGELGFQPDSGAIVQTTDTFAVLSGLDTIEMLSVNIFSLCDESRNCYPASAIKCPAAAIPYCENFNGYDDHTLPQCWNTFFTSQFPFIEEDHLVVNALANETQYIILQEIAEPINLLTLSFWLYSVDNTTGSIIIGALDDAEDLSTFTPIETIGEEISYRWQRMIVPLHLYNGSGHFLAIKIVAPHHCSFLVDDLKIEKCGISHLTADVISSDSTLVSWETFGDPSSVILEYGTEGFLPGTGTLVTTTDSTYLIGNLPPGIYDVYLSTLCIDSTVSCASEKITFKTMVSMPICENFDSYASGNIIPYGWMRYASAANRLDLQMGMDEQHLYHYPNGLQETTQSYPRISSYRAHTYSNSMLFFNNPGFSILATPPFETEGSTSLSVRFWAYYPYSEYVQHPEWGTYYYFYQYMRPSIEIGTLTDLYDYTSFVPLDTVRIDYGWVRNYCIVGQCENEYAVIIDNRYNNISNIAFRTEGRSLLYIDDIAIENCYAVQANATDIGASSATIQWRASENTGTVIEWGAQGFTRGTGNIDTVFSNTFSITGLETDRCYGYYLKPLCSSEPCSVWERCFSTDEGQCNCSGVFTPGEENDWTAISNIPERPGILHGQFVFNVPTSTAYNYFISSQVTIPVNEIKMKFFAYSNTTNILNSPFLDIGVMTDPTDTSTFSLITTIQATGNATQHYISLASYSGTGLHIVFRCRYNLSSNTTFTVQNLSFDRCLLPSSFEINNVTQTTVAITYTQEDSTMDGYWLYCRDITNNTYQMIKMDSVPFIVSGLLPHTNYGFAIQCDSIYRLCFCDQYSKITTLPGTELIPLCYYYDTPEETSLRNNWTYFWGNCSITSFPRCTDSLYIISTLTDVPSSPGCLLFNNYNSHYVSPQIDDPIASLFISFQAKGSLTNQIMEVGILTDPYDIYSFSLISTLYLRTTWENYVVSLSAYSGTGKYIAIRMLSAGSYPVYIDNLSVNNCGNIDSVTVTNLSSTSSLIHWAAADNVIVALEYGISGFTRGHGITDTAYTTSLLLDSLLPFTNYTVYLTTICENSASCIPVIKNFKTLPPHQVPAICVDFDTVQNGKIPYGWSRYDCHSWSENPHTVTGPAHSQPHSLQFFYTTTNYFISPYIDAAMQSVHVSFWTKGYNGCYLQVGIMTNPYDTSTFTTLFSAPVTENFWEKHTFSFANYQGEGKYIAFRYPSKVPNYYSLLYLDDISIDTCGVNELTVTDITASTALISWHTNGNSNIVIEYGEQGFTPGTGLVAIPDENPYTIRGLDILTNYDVYLTYLCECNSDTLKYTFFTPTDEASNCLDYTSLHASHVTATTGTFNNPRLHVGVVDYSYTDINSRHTVHYNPAETDPRTGGQLHTVPPGGVSSVRLGNWNSGSEAESITYAYLVDSNDFELLILQYAAVLQDPDHVAAEQPRFTFEILDADNNLINPICGAADFIANPNLGWNIYGTGRNMVLWKDWTTVGIDISSYHGQVVYLRLTTYDCLQGEHYGYAYFDLQCARKTVLSSNCGATTINTFSAPEGFNYAWYNNRDTGIISTDRTITVSGENISYYCLVSFTENPECNFTVHTFAGTRYPFSDFSHSMLTNDCKSTVFFTNNSAVSREGDTLISTGERCETSYWDFGNGETSSHLNARSHYDQPGNYVVTLVSGIAHDLCTDTSRITIHIPGPDTTFVNDYICRNKPYNKFGFSFPGDSTGAIRHLAASRLLRATRTGCDSLVFIDVEVKPIYRDTLAGQTCKNSAFNAYNFNISSDSTRQTGTFFFTRSLSTSCCECDSFVVLKLNITPWYDDTIRDYICQNNAYTDHGFLIPEDSTQHVGTIESTRLLNTVSGCDSIVTLQLSITPAYNDTLHDNVCQGSAYSGNEFNISPDLTHVVGVFPQYRHLSTIHRNCDSTIVLMLNVKPTYHDTIHDRTCSGNAYNNNNFEIPAALTQNVDMLTTSRYLQSNLYDCDSVITLALTVIDTSASIEQLNSDFCDEYAATLNVSTPFENYLWNTGATTSSIYVTSPGTYSVTVSNPPCYNEKEFIIPECPINLFMPNAITPNNDNLNDYFCISEEQIALIEEADVYIYDRWGELVFHSNDKHFKWDGKYKGILYRNNVYDYVLYYKGKNHRPYYTSGCIIVL